MTKPENAVCYGRLHFFISGRTCHFLNVIVLYYLCFCNIMTIIYSLLYMTDIVLNFVACYIASYFMMMGINLL